MPRLLVSLVLACLLAGACGSAQPSPSPVITAAPTPVPTVASTPTAAPTTAATQAANPFAGQPYAMDLPAGWNTFDLSDPAGEAALDTFVQANPEMAASIEAFKALPNVVMAVNPLVGNVMVSLSTPSGGLALDSMGTSFTAQFQAVPGVKSVTGPETITLPIGPALHWDLTLQANAATGGTSDVKESIYLVSNATTAILVEFVEVAGAGVPQEDQIMQTLRFTP